MVSLVYHRLNTVHRRITFGILMVIGWYLIILMQLLVSQFLNGQSTPALNLGAIALGVTVFRKQYPELKSRFVRKDDRILGYFIAGIGLVGFGIFQWISPSPSFQSFAIMVMVIGLVWSSWGIEIFRRFPLPFFLFLLGLYPNLFFLMMKICQTVTPPNVLENLMAWGAALGLQLLRFEAVAQSIYVILPQGSIAVLPGCSGFEMILVMLGVSVLVGQFMALNRVRTIALMAFGGSIALLLNVFRIMLMTLASVYWGKAYFDFWHGPIGGQIFSTILFTIYYYGAIEILKDRTGENCKLSE